MGKLIFVPIEPLKERYSAQWLEWFKKDFNKSKIDYYIIGDTRLRKIKKGEFLDIFDTNTYKLNQMSKIIKLVKNGFSGTIFFMDLWFPSLECLAYIRSCSKKQIRIEGILHAGTWDSNDYLTRRGCGNWAKDLEKSWLKLIDKVYVATEYHKKLIIKSNSCPKNYNHKKIQVVKFPCYTNKDLRKNKKQNIVVFPHRLAPEKRPELFEELERKYKKMFKNTDVRFIKTKDVSKTKEQYYNLLSRSKIAVSFALQETFGIAMLEALNLGCIPVCPNSISYKETMPSKYRTSRINDIEYLCRRINYLIKNYNIPKQSRYNESVKDIIKRIKK